MSLRGRFVTASSVVSLVVLSAAFSAVWAADTEAQERQLDSILQSQAMQDARDPSRSAPSNGTGHLVLHHSELWPMTKYGALYDSQGIAIDWTETLESARPRIDLVRHPFGIPFDLWWNNTHLRCVLTKVPGDGDRSLLLATPRTDVDGDVRDLAKKMLAALSIAVIASAAITAWLARMLTRDHDRITCVAREVAAGDLSARIGSTSRDPEMARLGRDLDDMISRLAILVETQQRFIANASHELRSPITTLLGELSLALHRPRDAASYRSSIEAALGAARELKVVTEDLLTLARIGASDLTVETVALSDVARVAVASTHEVAQARDIGVRVTCDGTAVRGHAGDLGRLLRNLVENAIRHSPPGTLVRIDARSDAESAHLAVCDDGPGIPPSVRERIFEPFFRLAADRADESGAGLGLAIARDIARAHGGDLQVDESLHGACFVVHLPLAGPGKVASA